MSAIDEWLYKSSHMLRDVRSKTYGGIMAVDKSKMRPVTFSIFCGSIEKAQKRRVAYEKQAELERKTLGRWARDTLDEKAGFKE